MPIISIPRAARIIFGKWGNYYGYLPDAFVMERHQAGGHLGFRVIQPENGQYVMEQLRPEVIQMPDLYKEGEFISVISARGHIKKGYAHTGINVHLSEEISSVKEVVSELKLQFLKAEIEHLKQDQP